MRKLIIILLLLGVNFELKASDRLKNIILNAPSNNYVIQIASIPEFGNLDELVREQKLPKRLVAVKTLVNGQNRWAILEGIYQNKKEAEKAAKALQASNAQIKPWIRSIGSFKQVLATQSKQ